MELMLPAVSRASCALSSIEKPGRALLEPKQADSDNVNVDEDGDDLQVLESLLLGTNASEDPSELDLELDLACARNIDDVTDLLASLEQEQNVEYPNVKKSTPPASDPSGSFAPPQSGRMKTRKSKYRGVSQTTGNKWGAKYGKHGRILGASTCSTPAVAARAYDDWLKVNKPEKCRRFLNYCSNPLCRKFRNPLSVELTPEEQREEELCQCNDKEKYEQERRERERKRKRDKRREEKSKRTGQLPSSITATKRRKVTAASPAASPPVVGASSSSSAPGAPKVDAATSLGVLVNLLHQPEQQVPAPPCQAHPPAAQSFQQLRELLRASAAVASNY